MTVPARRERASAHYARCQRRKSPPVHRFIDITGESRNVLRRDTVRKIALPEARPAAFFCSAQSVALRATAAGKCGQRCCKSVAPAGVKLRSVCHPDCFHLQSVAMTHAHCSSVFRVSSQQRAKKQSSGKGERSPIAKVRLTAAALLTPQECFTPIVKVPRGCQHFASNSVCANAR